MVYLSKNVLRAEKCFPTRIRFPLHDAQVKMIPVMQTLTQLLLQVLMTISKFL